MSSASKRGQPFHAVPVIDRISEAVRKGDEEEFGQLISLFRFNETSNTLNQLDSDGSHPLHQAVVFRRLKMLKTMLHYKNSLNLDVCITDRHGLSALEIAIKNKNRQALEKLVKHGGNATVNFEELRPEYLPSPEDREALLADASCRSEVAFHNLAVYRDCPNYGKRTNQHLLHPISGTHWSNETCEKAVQKCYLDLSKYMDAVLIVPLLVTSGHLPTHCVEKILSHQSQRERALQLLALLPRCGKHAYLGLFKALKEETELKVHQELLEQLESHCEVIQRTKTPNNGLDMEESLEKVTTIYHGDCPGTPTTHHQGLERSLELSGRTTESGIYSATPSGGMPATHSSSGRLSTPSRKSTYGSTSHPQSKRRKFSTVQEKPSVLVEHKINYEASSNFRAIDELSPRASLKVLHTIVKQRDSTHIQPTSPPLPPNISDGGGDGLLVAGSAHSLSAQATPYTCVFTRSQLQSTCTLDESLENPMLVSSGKSERDDIERDTTADVLRHSSPATSPPIDIPSRNESFATLPSSPTTRSPQKFFMRQISRDTSSDSSSSDIIHLDVPSQPKDLSHIPPVRRSLSGTFFGLLRSFKAKLSTVPDSSETTQSRTSSQRGTISQRGNCYSYGCGMRM